MNKLQKIALLNLGLATAGLFLQLIHFIISDLSIKLIASVMTFVLYLLVAALYVYRYKLARQGNSQYDERDKAIYKTSVLAGFITAFLIFFHTILIAFLTIGPRGSIDIGDLLTIFILGALGLVFADSIAVLIQYGRGGAKMWKSVFEKGENT